MAVVDYVEAQDVATHLIDDGELMDGDTGKYQPLMEALVTRASELVDMWFGHPLGHFKASSASVKYFDGNGELEIWPGHMAAAPTAVEVAEAGDLSNYTAWSASDYLVGPYNALAEGYPYRYLRIDQINGTRSAWSRYPKAVKITCQWGWSATPPYIIQEAVIVQCARWFMRGKQAFQDAGAVTELMRMRYLQKIDPEVELLLSRMPGGITI